MNILGDLRQWPPYARQLLNWFVTAGSVILCLLILPMRMPGIQLLGVAPNWLLIWVVAWSIRRTSLEGAIAGVILGLLLDGMTAPNPTHAISFALVGAITARLQKQRYLQEDFVSVALIVFGMAVVAETVTAIQFSLRGLFQLASTTSSAQPLAEIWRYHQRIALSSAILSSLWAPAIYYPLNRWWERIKLAESPKT